MTTHTYTSPSARRLQAVTARYEPITADTYTTHRAVSTFGNYTAEVELHDAYGLVALAETDIIIGKARPVPGGWAVTRPGEDEGRIPWPSRDAALGELLATYWQKVCASRAAE